jgi:hypothetical protein
MCSDLLNLISSSCSSRIGYDMTDTPGNLFGFDNYMLGASIRASGSIREIACRCAPPTIITEPDPVPAAHVHRWPIATEHPVHVSV